MYKKMVYLLEDDPDISEMIAYVLSEAGYDVEQCGTVSRFNEKLMQRIPDIFILDILLPDGNGMDVCCKLRLDQHTAMTPILVMSANQSKHEVAAAGCADDFIPKPFNIDYFRQRVDYFA
jgi:two-component system phosphate regulon response regulator PhoB